MYYGVSIAEYNVQRCCVHICCVNTNDSKYCNKSGY